MRTSTCLVVTVFLVALASCQNQNKDEPKFVTTNQKIEVNKADPITLPCIFEKLPSYYQVEWKKVPAENIPGTSKLLAIGDTLIDQNGKSVEVNYKVTAKITRKNVFKATGFRCYLCRAHQWLSQISMKLLFLTSLFYWLKAILIVIELI